MNKNGNKTKKCVYVYVLYLQYLQIDLYTLGKRFHRESLGPETANFFVNQAAEGMTVGWCTECSHYIFFRCIFVDDMMCFQGFSLMFFFFKYFLGNFGCDICRFDDIVQCLVGENLHLCH